MKLTRVKDIKELKKGDVIFELTDRLDTDASEVRSDSTIHGIIELKQEGNTRGCNYTQLLFDEGYYYRYDYEAIKLLEAVRCRFQEAHQLLRDFVRDLAEEIWEAGEVRVEDAEDCTIKAEFGTIKVEFVKDETK